jgi:hypothetical protein
MPYFQDATLCQSPRKTTKVPKIETRGGLFSGAEYRADASKFSNTVIFSALDLQNAVFSLKIAFLARWAHWNPALLYLFVKSATHHALTLKVQKM